MTTPAERYAEFRRRQAAERSELARFRATLHFPLDAFQEQACEALEQGLGVLVAAPTGAGKTVVGEFAVHLGLATGRKAFYTTPIKALSNQKYLDLVAAHGKDRVGLLTGDTSINGEAPVVVMTTEVLRNMLYAGSDTIDGLGFVIMDEVHYLADRFRGPVWEEVIIHLPATVQVVSLSATVSNAEEFGQWLGEVRGDTAVVVDEHRPVPLWQHMMVGNRLIDLYSAHVDPTNPGTDPPLNPELVDAIQRAQRTGSGRDTRRRRPESSGRAQTGRGGGRRGLHEARLAGGIPAARPAPRPVVVDRLDREGLLPAIVFVFSRAGCEAAVGQTMAAGIRLTTAAEAATIREVVERAVSSVPPEDLHVLGYGAWAHALEHGVAAHHAGLLPVFKETVEQLFAAGLVKVVYATETLALGINMPARSVVLERLVKWNGSAHENLTPGEYTQLTGRAGRRGIDVEGHAVVLWSQGLDPLQVAGLASRRTYPLRSAFHPTYNMAVNLLSVMPRARAREVLEMSFAQFQADRGVVGLARQARKQEEALAGYAEAMHCHLGDFTEYTRLRQQVSDREADLSRERSAASRRAAAQSMTGLRNGEVVAYRRGRRTAYGVVLGSEEGGFEGPRLRLLTDERQVRWLTSTEAPAGVEAVGSVRVPRGFNPRNPADRRDLASSLRNALAGGSVAEPEGRRKRPARADDDLEQLRRQLRAHPCHGCADREEHLRWANRWMRLNAEHEALLRRIQRRTGSVAQDFDRICALLTELGYLVEDGDGLAVTDDGRWLSRVYAEKDLVIAECLRRGAWEKLDAAELAAVLTATVFSSRGEEQRGPGPLPGGENGRLGQAVVETVRIAETLAEDEDRHGIRRGEMVDVGLVGAMHHWAAGGDLSEVLSRAELGAGDFVRWSKQVLDVLDQVATVAPTTRLATRARQASDLVRRGVVAWSSV